MSARRPTSFDLDDIQFEPELAPPETENQPPAPPVRRKRRWLAVLVSALTALAALGFGLAVDTLIRDLFARNDWLGWAAVGLAGLAGLAALALIWREIAGILRLRKIDRLRAEATEAGDTDDREAARNVVTQLTALYRDRPETARGRRAIAEHAREIIDGADLIALTERDLMGPLDASARAAVVGAARRVAVITAVSPRAIVDLAIVVIEILRLIRTLASIYGGRPGTLGFLRLARATLAHLAVTGGMAAGESIVQQILGHGLAARLSARLGEGVVNGLLTARIGIAAAEICRPMPWRVGTPPRIADAMAVLRPLGKKTDNGKD